MLSQRILTKQEEERRRIAYELHDGFGQVLLALRLNAQLLRNTITDLSPDETKQLDSLIDETGAGCDKLHDIIRGLRPASLSELGFAAALRELAGRSDLSEQICFRLEVEDGVDLSEDLESMFFRVAQEAMTNALKHAHANTISIHFAKQGDKVMLVVEDDGCGLPADAWRKDGVGLLAMRERITAAGGRLTVSSKLGVGTTIKAEVPAP